MNNKSNPIPQASNSEALASVSLPPTSGLRPQAPYVFPFEKLDVYQMAVDLADYVLGLLEPIPLNKHIRLVSQMEGAVVSVLPKYRGRERAAI